MTVSVTLMANIDFPTGSKVTIVGLTGTLTTNNNVLAVLSTDGSANGQFGTSGLWTQSTGTLALTAGNGGASQGATYTVRFDLQQGEIEQAAPLVRIAATIKDGSTAIGSIEPSVMSTDAVGLYGVAEGGKPMKVIVPSFSPSLIGQSTPVAGATVTVSVTLTANIDFPTGSKVTIVGLTGTQTADSVSLPVPSTSNRLGTAGVWTQSTGQLVLTAANGGTSQGVACTLTFDLRHAAAEYTPPSVSVMAMIKDGSTVLGSIAQVAMTPPNTPLLVANGANPLVVVVPEFDTRSIGQSNPLASIINFITITLQATINLEQGSVITISGLTNAVVAGGSDFVTLIDFVNNGASLFSDGSIQGRGAWS